MAGIVSMVRGRARSCVFGAASTGATAIPQSPGLQQSWRPGRSPPCCTTVLRLRMATGCSGQGLSARHHAREVACLRGDCCLTRSQQVDWENPVLNLLESLTNRLTARRKFHQTAERLSRSYQCRCGTTIFFRNTQCLNLAYPVYTYTRKC
jgi:hypothetical protein